MGSLKETKKSLSQSTKDKGVLGKHDGTSSGGIDPWEGLGGVDSWDDIKSETSSEKDSSKVEKEKIKKTVKSDGKNLNSDSKKTIDKNLSSINKTIIPPESSIDSKEGSAKKIGALVILVILIALYFFNSDSPIDNELISSNTEITSENKNSEDNTQVNTEDNPNESEVDGDGNTNVTEDNPNELDVDGNTNVTEDNNQNDGGGNEESSTNDNPNNDDVNKPTQDNSNSNNSTSVIVDENSDSKKSSDVIKNNNSNNNSTADNVLIKDKTIVANFNRGSFIPLNIDKILVEKMRSYLASNSNAKINLIGYSSSDGSIGLNKILSKKRAVKVKEKLISFGFDSSRIITKSGGISNPIASNRTRKGRSKNRRVEIILK